MFKVKCYLLMSNLNPFSYLGDVGITDDASVRGTAVSAYKFFMVIGIIGLVVTFILIGLRIALSKNSNKKSELKSALGYKTIIALGLFGFLSIAGLVFDAIRTLT